MKKEGQKEKEDKEIKYGPTVVECACGAKFETGSTVPYIKVEICSACHPFYTGKQKLVDTAGRVDRFKEKVAKAQSAKVAKEAKPAKKKETKEVKKVKEGENVVNVTDVTELTEESSFAEATDNKQETSQ